jgi:hypothetical protein
MIKLYIHRMAISGSDFIAGNLVSLLEIGLYERNHQFSAGPAMPARYYLAELGEINPTAGVHSQAQITGKMPKTARYQPTQLLRLGLVQKKLACRAALTMLSPEKSVLRATLDHQ